MFASSWIDSPAVLQPAHPEYLSIFDTLLQDNPPSVVFSLMWPQAFHIYLLRVGEAAALAPHHLPGAHTPHILTKTKSETASPCLAPIALAWAHLFSNLLPTHPPDNPIFPTEVTLHTGLPTLLFGTIRATFSWHSPRRGGAASIYQVGISWGAFPV
jgi:hypothetical protein